MSTENSSIHTKRYRQVLSAVHMIYRLVNSTYNVQELSLRLTLLLCQFIKGTSSTVYLLHPTTKKLLFKAVFNNQINMLIKKKEDLEKLTEDEIKVIKGFTVFEKYALGIPLVADDNVGAILIKRKKSDGPFRASDKEMLLLIAEQSVTAIRNFQLNEEQQKIILGSIELIGKFVRKNVHVSSLLRSPNYFKIIKVLGQKLHVRQEGIDSLYYATILRDVGAIDVPYEILSKTSQLTPGEFKVIRNQPTRSAELIRPVKFLKPVLPIILYHHEKYDGSGYPSGIKKEQIPLGARIMAVVDAFEAMTQDRPYKKKLTVKEALDELTRNSGTQFDPKVVSAFVQLHNQKKFRNYLYSKD